MSTALPAGEESSLTLHFGPVLQKMNDHEFFEFCQLNRDWRFERTHEGGFSHYVAHWRKDRSA